MVVVLTAPSEALEKELAIGWVIYVNPLILDVLGYVHAWNVRC